MAGKRGPGNEPSPVLFSAHGTELARGSLGNGHVPSGPDLSQFKTPSLPCHFSVAWMLGGVTFSLPLDEVVCPSCCSSFRTLKRMEI